MDSAVAWTLLGIGVGAAASLVVSTWPRFRRLPIWCLVVAAWLVGAASVALVVPAWGAWTVLATGLLLVPVVIAFDRMHAKKVATVHFVDGDGPPFERERAEWPNGKCVLVRTFSIGVLNRSDISATVRVVVESVLSGEERRVVERPLRMLGGGDSLVLPPSSPTDGDGPLVYVDVAEEYEGSEWAWLCFVERSNEDMLPRAATIILRAQWEGGVSRATVALRTHRVGGRHVGLGLYLVGQQRRAGLTSPAS